MGNAHIRSNYATLLSSWVDFAFFLQNVGFCMGSLARSRPFGFLFSFQSFWRIGRTQLEKELIWTGVRRGYNG
jgi:hypothetical protein